MKKAISVVLLAILVVTFLMATKQKNKELDKELHRQIMLEGNIDEVKKLIEAGVDVNKRTNVAYGLQTPLCVAVMMGKADIAKVLIDAGADVNENYKDAILLHVAAYSRDKAVTELLIAKGLDVNAKCTSYGEKKDATPLHFAAGQGNIEVADVLIKNGAEVNAKTFDEHYTPLHIAAQEGHKAVAELLIAKGADVNAKDKNGDTPLDLAKSKRNEELVDLLRKHGGISKRK